MYNANYLASKRDDFVDKMITMIRSSNNPMTIVHLIGHFYSQEYDKQMATNSSLYA